MSDSCLPVRRLIAEGPLCTVEECSCGVLHVTLGASTIRLQQEVVASIHETLGDALARLSASRRASSSTGDALFAPHGSTERPS